jgi:hypothetical protein
MNRLLESLQVGDEVRWNDPDDDLCTRTLTIATIRFHDADSDDPIVCITEPDGAYLECFRSELS